MESLLTPVEEIDYFTFSKYQYFNCCASSTRTHSRNIQM